MRYFTAFVLLVSLLCCGSVQATVVDPPAKSNHTRYGPYNHLLKRITRYAQRYNGSPYVYGGTRPEGFDCSGFVRYVFNEFNLRMTQNSVGLAKLGHDIDVSQARPGDLVFFDTRDDNRKVGHVGIVIANTNKGVEFIHASTSRGVIQSFLHEKYYREHFLGINRVVDELKAI